MMLNRLFNKNRNYTFLPRILSTVLVLFGVSVINFFLFHLSPGDPTNQYFGPRMNKEQIEQKREQLGLNEPWYKQYAFWFSNFARGDFGYSWSKHRAVRGILNEAVPATLQLTLSALFVNFILGSIIGIFAGIWSHRLIGRFLNGITLLLYAIPSFWLALIFVLVFSLKLQWLPPSGMSSLFLDDSTILKQVMDRIRHLILPVAVLGLTGAAATSRYIRAHMMKLMSQSYIQQAMAKGLSKWQVTIRHAFRNALVPVVTLLGLYFPFLLGGALVVEVIFAWPGMGRVAYEAIMASDMPVIMAVNLIAAVMVVIGNFISDILYRYVDPRIQALS